jgi:hypothetical protein
LEACDGATALDREGEKKKRKERAESAFSVCQRRRDETEDAFLLANGRPRNSRYISTHVLPRTPTIPGGPITGPAVVIRAPLGGALIGHMGLVTCIAVVPEEVGIPSGYMQAEQLPTYIE